MVPRLDLRHVGEAALGECTDQVQGRSGLLVGLEQTLRLRGAGAASELGVVDDVAAERGQFDAVDGLGVARAGLGELTGDAADLDDRKAS